MRCASGPNHFMLELTPTDGLSVVVFAYNEVENVRAVLSALITHLKEHEPNSEIIFVDDGSRDGSADEAAAALKEFPSQVVKHLYNQGIGAALKTGVRHATKAWVTFMPADGQIAPNAITTLRNEAQRSHADVVFSVYDNRNDGVYRKILSTGVRALIAALYQTVMRSDGPYLFRRALFLEEQLDSNSFFLNFEFPLRVLKAGLRTSVVTIECQKRRAGRSKSSDLKHIRAVAHDLTRFRLNSLRKVFLGR